MTHIPKAIKFLMTSSKANYVLVYRVIILIPERYSDKYFSIRRVLSSYAFLSDLTIILFRAMTKY